MINPLNFFTMNKVWKTIFNVLLVILQYLKDTGTFIFNGETHKSDE